MVQRSKQTTDGREGKDGGDETYKINIDSIKKKSTSWWMSWYGWGDKHREERTY